MMIHVLDFCYDFDDDDHRLNLLYMRRDSSSNEMTYVGLNFLVELKQTKLVVGIHYQIVDFSYDVIVVEMVLVNDVVLLLGDDDLQ